MNWQEIWRNLDSGGSRPYLQLGERCWTYEAMAQRVQASAALLAERGLQPGDRLLVSTRHEEHMIALVLAGVRSGLTVIVVDSTVKQRRLESILANAAPALLALDQERGVQDPRVLRLEKEAPKKSLARLLLGRKQGPPSDGYPGNLESSRPPLQWSPQEDSRPALVFYTSGSTADPKGVILTQGNLAAHLTTLIRVYGLTEESRIHNILNLYHADGLNQGPLLALASGCTLYRPLTFSLERLAEFAHGFHRLRISHAIVVPALLAMLDRYGQDVSDAFQGADFRVLVSVSAHLEEALWRRFSEAFGIEICNVYGLTESVAGSLFCGPAEENARPGTIGKPVDCEVKIVGEDGELCLRGAHISPGYLNNTEASEATFRDGWLYTGDIASCDAEGFYKIEGRKKSLVISGGFNIHPEEVAELLLSHPAVTEAFCFGVADPVFGERLVAMVVSTDQESQLVEFCREQLEPEKVPRELVLVSALPRGLSGKVQLPGVLALYGDRQPKAETGRATTFDRLLELAQGVFQLPPGSLERSSNSTNVSGWDSLSHLNLITALERTFGVRFATAEILTMNSLTTIELVLERHLEAS